MNDQHIQVIIFHFLFSFPQNKQYFWWTVFSFPHTSQRYSSFCLRTNKSSPFSLIIFRFSSMLIWYFSLIADPVFLTLHRDIACIRSKIPVCWHINECGTFHSWFVQILCRIHHISVPFPDRPDIMHNSFRMVQPEIDNSSHPLPLLIFLLSLLS